MMWIQRAKLGIPVLVLMVALANQLSQIGDVVAADDAHESDVRAFIPAKNLDVSMGQLAFPLGIVSDVDVDESGTVYLLDSTGQEVRRINASGEIMSSLRGVNEGRGELMIPALIAVAGDGSCSVTQAISRKIAKYDADGRSLYQEEVFDLGDDWPERMQLRAETDDSGRLFLASVGATGGDGAAGGGEVSAVLHMITGDLVTVLMHAGRTDYDLHTIDFEAGSTPNVIHGWDINGAGELVFGNPDEGNSICIGSPGGRDYKKTKIVGAWTIDPGDNSEGTLGNTRPDAGKLPKVVYIRWVGDDRLLVQFTRRTIPMSPNSAGTFDVIRRDGTMVGRFEIRCQFDPNHDKLFIRKSKLIIIQGGEMIARSFYRKLPDGNVKDDDEFSTPPPDEIKVRCYDLSGIGVARSLSNSGLK